MIVIVGAGPAGLAAATAAAKGNEDVVILDSAPRPGGQYWRHINHVTGYRGQRSMSYFAEVENSPRISYIHSAQVWSASETDGLFTLNYLKAAREESIKAEKIILATGAYDRSLPFAGWEKPGVMTPGAAQALLKGQGVVAGKKIVIAGTGPFLLPVATGLSEAGAKIVGLYEAQSPLRWLLSPIALLRNPEKLMELVYYIRLLKRHSLRPQFGRTVIEFSGDTAVISKVRSNLTSITGSEKRVECDVVAVGWGFVPDVTLGGILGCAQILDEDETVIFDVDARQRSSKKNIWIAGEGTGIGGSDLALLEGEIAGRDATGQVIPASLSRKRKSKSIFGRALQRSYPVGDGWQQWPEVETNICRCEEVSLKEISQSVVELSAEDSRSAKLFTRAGMGLCQGRICSRNVSEIVASLNNCKVKSAERIAYSNRPISAPISLGQLSDGIAEK